MFPEIINIMNNVRGIKYRLVNNWYNYIPIKDMSPPLRYLEVGVLCGANAISFDLTYGKHPDTKIYCIDPWDLLNIEYNECYNQSSNYQDYLHNIAQTGHPEKFKTIKGFSNIEIPKLEDNSFDIIYIDGNHNPENVLEDAILSFRKLKVGGYMIFDDYGWDGPDLTQKGIDAFINTFSKKIKILGFQQTQCFIIKITDCE